MSDRLIGTDFPMRDAQERVTGTVQYVLDHHVDGMLHAYVVRSQVPHAKIVGVDTEFALDEPGVVAVITGQDVRGHPDVASPLFGTQRWDQPILAYDTVRFAGEPVAVVLADTRRHAKAAALQVFVDYEEMDYATDPELAINGGSPPLHADHADNLCARWRLRHGDVEKGFAEADRIYEQTYYSPPANHVPMEPHVALARWTGGEVEIWTSCQAPHSVRHTLSRVFGRHEEDVRVHAFNLGGAYGAKTTVKIEPLVGVASRISGRPVKLQLDRDEVFVTTGKHPARVRLRTGVSNDGTFVARQVHVLFGGGAYADTTPGGSHAAMVRASGPYRIPNVAVDIEAAYTNTVPNGPFRGAYTSQLVWAYESQIDEIAQDLGIDPLVIRRRNLLEIGDIYPTGETMEDVHYQDLLNECEAVIGQPLAGHASGLRRTTRAHRGKGYGVMIKSQTAPSRSELHLRLRKDGFFQIFTSAVEMGQGAHATLTQLAADALHVGPARIDVLQPDTNEAPYDLKTASSRTTFTMGSALLDAVNRLIAQVEDLSSHASGNRYVDTHADGAAGLIRDTEQVSELLGQAELSAIDVVGVYQSSVGLSTLDDDGQGIAADHWHQGAVGVEIEVDIETGKINVLKCHGSAYAGRVINPMRVHQQTVGGMTFALGLALFEESIYDSGQLINPNLSDYMIPSIIDSPTAMTSSPVISPDADADPYGVGEMTTPPFAAAVANALFDATGIRIRELPLTPERVLRALREHVGEEASR